MFLKGYLLWHMFPQEKAEGNTGYAIEFSCSGLNRFGGSFSAVKFRHDPARRASFSSVVAGDSYLRGRLHAD